MLRARRQRVAKTEMGERYSIIRTWRGENQLLSVGKGKEYYQKLFNENVLGSHIDSSQACFLPPSSAKLGVDGRRDFLHISKLQQ